MHPCDTTCLLHRPFTIEPCQHQPSGHLHQGLSPSGRPNLPSSIGRDSAARCEFAFPFTHRGAFLHTMLHRSDLLCPNHAPQALQLRAVLDAGS